MHKCTLKCRLWETLFHMNLCGINIHIGGELYRLESQKLMNLLSVNPFKSFWRDLDLPVSMY